jgi:hypothetical protein
MLIVTLRYYAILEEHKRLTELQCNFNRENLQTHSFNSKLTRRLDEFNAKLEFETWGSVRLIKLDNDNN